MRTFRWEAVPRRNRLGIQQCVVEGHTLIVKRVRPREYIAGIDGLNMDQIFHTMKYAKESIQKNFAQRFPPCNHKNYKIAASYSTLTRYKCTDCGFEWEVDSSG